MSPIFTHDTQRQAEQVLAALRLVYERRPVQTSRDPLDQLIGTILSQHTSDRNSEAAFASLRARFPDWRAVAAAPVDEIVDAIRQGGLANVKAPRIQQVLQAIHADCGRYDLEFLRALPLADARTWLLGLPGVGPKTAACVLLFALEQPALPVDTHVYRVASRLGLIANGMSAEAAHEHLEALLAPDDVYDFHVTLIAHGREVCHARKPRCHDCVLLELCPYGQKERQSQSVLAARD